MSERDSRVYIGNLPPDIREKELEEMFTKYGKIVNMNVKYGDGRGPAFAFLEYDDPRDADDAIKYKDRQNFDGYNLRVEACHGGRGGRGRGGGYGRGGYGGYDRGGYGGGRGGYGGGRGGYGGGYDRGYGGRGGYDRGGYDRGYDRGDRYGGGGSRRSRSPIKRNSSYKVTVTGLPDSATTQDLKEHMRDAGDVAYATIDKDGNGIVEFTKYDDMKYAIRKLDDTKFKSEEGDTNYIRIKEDTGKDRSRSRSRSPRRSPPPRRDRTRSGSPKGRSNGKEDSPRGSPRRRRTPSASPKRRSRSRSNSS